MIKNITYLLPKNFEEAIKELETLVKYVESGNICLEQSIIAYERGDMLRKFCELKLENAKMRVEQINITKNNEIVLEPFYNNK